MSFRDRAGGQSPEMISHYQDEKISKTYKTLVTSTPCAGELKRPGHHLCFANHPAGDDRRHRDTAFVFFALLPVSLGQTSRW